MTKKLIHITALLLLMISAAGCTDPEEIGEVLDDSGKVNLLITIYSRASAIESSRATFDNVDFEGPMTQYERMRTLRVILVRPDGKVEHNVLISSTIPDTGLDGYSNVRLKVVGGETKQVYLFANEESIDNYNFNNIYVGGTFPKDEVSNLILATAAPGEPLIDNMGEDPKFVPMNEVFSIAVAEAAQDGSGTDQAANLFITRAVVKFTFHALSTTVPSTPYKITELVIDSIGNKEYMMPKGAEYKPEKSGFIADRYITDFIPPVAEYGSYTFTPDIFSFGKDYVANTELVYAPAIYFPETKLAEGKQFTLKIKLEGDTTYIATVPLENLPILPRNTNVKVNIKFDKSDFKCNVDVLPYTAVDLNPKFGFDSLMPRPPVHPGENPPWITIPKPGDPDPDE